jgi:hypothetical protein
MLEMDVVTFETVPRYHAGRRGELSSYPWFLGILHGEVPCQTRTTRKGNCQPVSFHLPGSV